MKCKKPIDNGNCQSAGGKIEHVSASIISQGGQNGI